jgi:hypothetical protein
MLSERTHSESDEYTEQTVKTFRIVNEGVP